MKRSLSGIPLTPGVRFAFLLLLAPFYLVLGFYLALDNGAPLVTLAARMVTVLSGLIIGVTVLRSQAMNLFAPLDAAGTGSVRSRRKYLVPRELPPAPPAFVGRDDELRRLHGKLDSPRATQSSIAVIRGPAGIGKSALAIKFAHQVAGDFDDGQLYMRLWEEHHSSEQLLERFVRALTKPGEPLPAGERALRDQYSQMTKNGRVLIVLDDVAPDFDIMPLWPSGPGCLLIITCRKEPRLPAGDVTGIALKELAPDEALKLLGKTIGEERVRQEPEESAALVRRCHQQPLALRMTGTALANRPNWALQFILAQAQAPPDERVSLVKPDDEPEPRWFDAVYALLTVDEQQALRALHRLSGPRFSPRMLSGVLAMDEHRAGRLAARLADAGLIERYSPNSGATSYWVQDTVLTYSESLQQRPLLGAEPQISDRWPGGRPGDVPAEVDVRARQVRSTDDLLRMYVGFTQAIEAMRDAMDSARRAGDRSAEAIACAALAELYAELGDLMVAEDLAQRAISLAARLTDMASVTQACGCLSRIERHRNSPETAVEQAGRALRMAQTGGDRSAQIRALLESALALCTRGKPDDFSQALHRCMEAKSLCNSGGERSGRLMATVFSSQARVHLAAHEYADALLSLKEARPHAERHRQPLYLAWIDYLHARVATELLDHEEAESRVLRALDAFTMLRHRFGVAHCQYELGRLHRQRHRPAAAAGVLRQALETFSGCGDRLMLTHARLELALAYQDAGEFRRAGKLRREALASYRRLGYAPGVRHALEARRRTLLRYLRLGGLPLPMPLAGAAILFAVGLVPYPALRVGLAVLGAIIVLVLHSRYRRSASGPAPRPQRFELPSFSGREDELRQLMEVHEFRSRLRGHRHRDPGTGGPLILAVHGAPGVGKTALAQQLALRLGKHYGKWQLFANMGTAGGPRPPRDVLHDLLRQLGWPSKELQGMDAQALAGVFRAETMKNDMLIVLDAARSLEQILAVLPGGSGCTVIVTSRANYMAGRAQRTLPLRVPSGREATEILLRSIGRTDAPAPPELLAEAIELCGRQTNALRVVADRARNDGLGPTVARLRDGEHRLESLRYGGRDVAERFESEYAGLEALERDALLLLTIPETQTFVPWVLQPLLEIGADQAGNLMTSISRVGLLDIEEPDVAGFARYRLSPLMRLFARQRIAAEDIPAERLVRARHNFRLAYLEGSLRVLSRIDATDIGPPWPGYVPDAWLPDIPGWDGLIADRLRAWVRAEFGNLVRTVHEAARVGQHAACWQIAARLGDCYATPVRHQTVREAFAIAVDAARAAGSAEGEIAVRIARSGYLSTVTDYPAAVSELRSLEQMGLTGPVRVAVARRLEHALHEIGLHRAAAATGTNEAARPGDVSAEEVRGRPPETGGHEAVTGLGLSRWGSARPGDLGPDDSPAVHILAGVLQARDARRRRDVPAAEQALNVASGWCREELADEAALDAERVELYLHCRRHRSESGDGAPRPEDVTRLAAQAVRSFDRIGRPIGRVRARLAFGRALLQTGKAADCMRQLDEAQRIMAAVPGTGRLGLAAWLSHVRGEALLRQGDLDGAVMALDRAGVWFGAHEHYAHAMTLSLLGEVRRKAGDHTAALADFQAAERFFAERGDEVALKAARRNVAAVRWAMHRDRITLRGAREPEQVAAPRTGRRPPAAENGEDELPGLLVTLHRDGDDPVRVGNQESLDVDVRWRDGAGADRVPERTALRVVVLAGGTSVRPATRITELTRTGIEGPLGFSFTPARAGRLVVRVKVHEARTDFLLHEIKAEVDVEAEARTSTRL